MASFDLPAACADESSRRSFLGGIAVTALSATGAAILTESSALASNENLPVISASQQRARTARNFRDIRLHENEHVAALVGALGSSARPRPIFKNLRQGSINEFLRTSQALENTGCAAYLGAAPAILSRQYLAVAGSIAFVEARHAGWLNTEVAARLTTNVLGMAPSFERGLAAADIAALAAPFVESLNGGPPLTYSTTPSAANDIAILNFALALEFLEQEYYNINVPVFIDN